MLQIIIFCIFLQERVWDLQCYTGGKKSSRHDYLYFIVNFFSLLDLSLRQVWQCFQPLTNYELAPRRRSVLFLAIRQKGPSLLLWPHGQPTPAYSTCRNVKLEGLLRAVNPNKTGPDSVLGKVIKACADQLSGVLMRIFIMSLKQAIIPPCLKVTTTKLQSSPSPQKILKIYRWCTTSWCDTLGTQLQTR